MASDIRANRIVVEVDDALLAALDAEVVARSTNLRRVSRTEVLRELIAEHIVPGGKKVSVAG